MVRPAVFELSFLASNETLYGVSGFTAYFSVYFVSDVLPLPDNISSAALAPPTTAKTTAAIIDFMKSPNKFNGFEEPPHNRLRAVISILMA
jgi:hypothetical protein